MEKLKHSLEKLHEELKNASSIDDESKEMLRKLIKEIRVVLDKTEAPSGKKHQSLIEGLKEEAQKFEVSHPDLAGAINIVINGLQSLGI